MDSQYYLGMAQRHGLGDPAKEALWLLCPEEERLSILRHLVTYRSVIENCQFEEELDVEQKDIPAALDKLLQEWSKVEFGDLPLTLGKFVFFAYWGNGFSIDFLKRNANRYLRLPEVQPSDRNNHHQNRDFQDSIY